MNEAKVYLHPLRKSNSNRPVPPLVHYMSSYRRMIETDKSLIDQLLPKHIYAVTDQGFGLKEAIFVLA